jgi:hypothetical protein
MLFAVGNQREPAAREPRTAVGSEKVLKTRTGCRRLEMRRGGRLLRALLADVSFGEIGAQSQDRPSYFARSNSGRNGSASRASLGLVFNGILNRKKSQHQKAVDIRRLFA